MPLFRSLSLLLFGFLLACSFTACQLLPAPAVATATPDNLPSTLAAEAVITPGVATATITPTPSNTNQIIVWVPPEIAARTVAGTAVLSDQFFAFRADHPGQEIVFEQKAVSGQGGILSYLRTGRNVAPNILPDLIALPIDQLAAAAAEQLIYPLDDLLSDGLYGELYPVAQVLGRSNEQVVGYPFALTHVTHLAYNTTLWKSPVPTTWTEWTTNFESNFIFPSAGQEGAALVWQMYLAEGGTMVNDAGQPALQVEPLTAVFDLLHLARDNGFILLQSSNTATLGETWQIFQAGSATFSMTTAEQFLRERVNTPFAGFAPIPGPTGPLAPQVDGWAWAITTPDPVRQAQAMALLETLVDAENLGAWSSQSNILPARQSAFDFWPSNDAYIQFIQGELEKAQPNRAAAGSAIILVLRDGVFNVIGSSQSPQVAAEEAVLALQP